MDMILAHMGINQQRSAITRLPNSRQGSRTGKNLVTDGLHVQKNMVLSEAVDNAGEFSDHFLPVIPAKAGILLVTSEDSGFRRNDDGRWCAWQIATANASASSSPIVPQA